MRDKKENRLIFIQVIVVLLMLIIGVRLFNVMVSKGDYYRDLSDNRKVKEVDELASRGNIYDRNGKLLASSIPSFTIKLYKDELMAVDADKRQSLISDLVDILEEDGVNYTEDFNIKLNTSKYKDFKDYFSQKEMPIEKVVDTIIDNDLVSDFLFSFYEKDGMKYETANTAILALKKRGIDIPAHANQVNGNLKLEYKKNYEKKLASIGFTKDDEPTDVILESVGNDRSVLLSILQNSHARLLAYKLLEDNNLLGKLTMDEYAIKADQDLIEKKARLHKVFDKINLKSTPANDFYEIVKNATISDVLTSAMVDDKGAYVIPANMLIEQLENKGIYANFETEVITESKDDKNQYSVDVRFRNPQAGSAVDELARLADENGLLKPLLLSEYVKYMAQNANTKNNIYPNIDITEDDPEDWSYTFTTDKKDFYTYYANKDKTNSTKETVDILMKEKNGQQILKYLKKVTNLEAYNDVEAVGILTIDNTLNRQGNFGYRPINIVYNLDESTVLKIEEKIDSASGIVVETMPIRSYPNRNLASHILGYMGPIATPEEVDKYVKERNYLRDEIIGKTGIEESYQDNLKGKNGRSLVTVDSAGNRRKLISQTKSEPGDDVYLSIDAKLQKQAEDSLKGVLEALRETGFYESEYGSFRPFKMAPHAESGAVVVSDVKTGEVLAMASYPNYDPNLFSTGISQSDWEGLQVEESDGPLAPRPMLNIATQTAVMPGSTFKLVTALAALEKGLDPLAVNNCHGFMEIGNRRFSCLIYTESGTTHGEENLYGAIRDSCNYYFYTLALGENPEDGDSLGTKLELNDIRLAAEMLGLDKETGIEINIPKEAKGNVPSIGKKVEVTKLMLKDYLDKNLTLFIKEGVKKTKDEYEQDIKDIVKFTDNPKEWSRKAIIDFFDERGYDPLIMPEGQRAGLADTIKYTYLNQAVWDITDMLNIVIGQGQNSYTPIQMNRAIATITNGGYLNKLTLINKIKNHDSGEVLFENVPHSDKIDIKDPKYLEDIKYGTLLVSQNNAVLNQLPVDIGIKTGTAEVEGQNPDGTDYDTYAWMVGFAPYDNPEIAISIVLTQGDTSYNASPIMRDIIARYFDLNVEMINAEPTENDIRNLGESANGQN
ncbi:penicillin-binding transpeptidase domain-containing protein [Anaerococcus sp. NML200537]|uniref:penicillin-binding transpeptidase domain-containing protein n=1 Tax=Anaerococcus sp. NML200537 TaxID=2954485 RepID=UPI002238024D|nr:penicillin-binding transpeptidase domain-containing protein [Anaerococcus sp. NML200537]MCW6701649.1 penicillin-binding transpeptidase domain-containing protein [Anaerococcus sp. NML200537]